MSVVLSGEITREGFGDKAKLFVTRLIVEFVDLLKSKVDGVSEAEDVDIFWGIVNGIRRKELNGWIGRTGVATGGSDSVASFASVDTVGFGVGVDTIMIGTSVARSAKLVLWCRHETDEQLSISETRRNVSISFVTFYLGSYLFDFLVWRIQLYSHRQGRMSRNKSLFSTWRYSLDLGIRTYCARSA